MKIGVAGPMSLKLLDFDFKDRTVIPEGYNFPLISLFINALLRRGHEVVAYTTSRGIDRPVIYEGKPLTVCIARKRPCRVGRDLHRYERRGLVELMRRFRADIIHAHWSYEFAWAALDSGIPSLVTLHDHAPTIFKFFLDPYRFTQLIMNWVVMRKADYTSVVSEYLYGLLGEREKRKARIITNFYSQIHEEYSAKAVDKSNFILSVSNDFSRRKNINNGLKAFSIIRRNNPALEYHLVGTDMEVNGPAYKYAVRHKLAKGVKFLGRLPYSDVMGEIKRTLLVLHPSREESCCLSVLEAMVIGTPVVAGRHSGGVPLLLDGGNAGVLCDINSPADIAQGALKVLSDGRFAESLAAKAREFAKENFTEEKIVGEYINYYKDILGEIKKQKRLPKKSLHIRPWLFVDRNPFFRRENLLILPSF